MVAMSSQIQWLAPSPLWKTFTGGADKTAFRSPTLMRFSSDTFMADLQSLLANTPSNLASYVAQPENWRHPAVGLSPGNSTATASSDPLPTTLKLFQPVHARFYLVTAALVCRMPSLPDRTVKTNHGERVSFVLRRLQLRSTATNPAGSPFDSNTYDEYAWIPGITPPGWLQADGSSIAPGEEQLPLFGTQFLCGGTQRRMFAGVIPVGKRQAYVGGLAMKSTNGQITPDSQDDPRKTDFQRQVLDPWGDLVSWASSVPDINLNTLPLNADTDAAAQGSAYILIDFANYLAANLPSVSDTVNDVSKVGDLTGAQLDLYNAMSATLGDALDATRRTLAQAIALAKQHENDFNNEVLPDTPSKPSLPPSYPGLLLTDTTDPLLVALIGRATDTTPLPKRKIQTLVEAALDQAGSAPASLVPPPANSPQNPQGDDWYMVRCVYERPQCTVKTLPSAPIISPPSHVFQLASYFDPDAPARRIQVALPVDTTPAALRKYDKGVAFMISDQLNRQMQRVTGLQDLMDGKVGDGGGFSLGMICSFSIPIITICAFIVLFIFVMLLNIIFFWLPFLKICLPLPSFSAKGNS